MANPQSGWRRHLFYRKESLKTTWKLRLAVIFVLGASVWLTGSFWSARLGQSLICTEQLTHADALLLENFDPNYLVFERAEALQREGYAQKIFVPVSSGEEGQPNSVSKGMAELMARIARIPSFEVLPIQQVEPISLNAANQIRDALLKENVSSILVVTPEFRSRRSALVYGSVLTAAGIRVGCVPVFGTLNPTNWTRTWHGIQEVLEQFLKLQYYRFYVLW